MAIDRSETSSSLRIGVVGATGAVGKEILRLLWKREFPGEVRALASERSAGRQLRIDDKVWEVEETRAEVFDQLDLALMSVSTEHARELVPEARARGCMVIDNSSAFRMEADVPLVIPEINAEAAESHRGLIANINCTGAISMMALYPLHSAFGLETVFASSYQAVSGAGAAAMEELDMQVRAHAAGMPGTVREFPHPIAFNLIPRIDKMGTDGYTGEELKMVNEMRKVMNIPNLRASCTCVRVPVMRAHAIALHAAFRDPVDLEKARQAIEAFPGVDLIDDPAHDRYPMPLHVSGQENCAVGRLRRDSAFANGLALWVVGDQLWKGAALNAVQIAELLLKRDWLRF